MTSSPTSPPPDYQWDPHNRLLTIAEAALSINRPESTIRRWITQGDLRITARFGHRPLVLESNVLATEARMRGTVRPPWNNKKPPQEP